MHLAHHICHCVQPLSNEAKYFHMFLEFEVLYLAPLKDHISHYLDRGAHTLDRCIHFI